MIFNIERLKGISGGCLSFFNWLLWWRTLARRCQVSAPSRCSTNTQPEAVLFSLMDNVKVINDSRSRRRARGCTDSRIKARNNVNISLDRLKYADLPIDKSNLKLVCKRKSKLTTTKIRSVSHKGFRENVVPSGLCLLCPLNFSNLKKLPSSLSLYNTVWYIFCPLIKIFPGKLF